MQKLSSLCATKVVAASSLLGLAAASLSPLAPEGADASSFAQVIKSESQRAVGNPQLTPGWSWVVKPDQFREYSRNVPADKLSEIRIVPTDNPELLASGYRELDWSVAFYVKRSEGASYQASLTLKSGETRTINPVARDTRSFVFALPVDELGKVGFQVGEPDKLKELADAAFHAGRQAGVFLLQAGERGAPFEFQLRTVEGKVIDQSVFNGKVGIIFEWATWCMACMPVKNAIMEYAAQNPDGVAVIAVSHDGSRSKNSALRMMASSLSGAMNVALFDEEEKGNQNIHAQWALSVSGVASRGIPNAWIVKDGVLVEYMQAPNAESIAAKLKSLSLSR